MNTMYARLSLIGLALLSPLSYANSGHPLAPPFAAILPAEAQVRLALHQLPELRTGKLQQELAAAQQQKLNSGSHEWQLRLAQTKRKDAAAEVTRDQEISVERAVRWFGKASQDQALGEKGKEIARIAHADIWHEAARGLLTDWFDTLRAMRYRQQVEEQLVVLQEVVSIASKRVKAGEAARLEQQLAETELQRQSALLQQAQLREEQLLRNLQTRYPELPAPTLTVLPQPLPAVANSKAIEEITEDNHEVELLELEAEMARMQASRVRADTMPDPVLGIRAARERNGQDSLIGFSISIPLSGTARQADAQAAVSKAGIAQAKLDQVRSKVFRDAQRVVAEREQSYRIWQTLHNVSQQSQAQAQTMLKAYQLGEVSLTDSLQIRRNAMEARLNAETAQLDALMAQARFELDAHHLWSID